MKGKVVCITGASSGIGAACAHIFAAAGAKLLLIARRKEKLDALVATLPAGTLAQCLVLDVRENAAVEQSIAALAPDWQAVDLLINNAGLAKGLDTVAVGKAADWDAMIDTNIKGVLYMTRVLLPGMLARNRGHLINIGSVSGRATYIGGAVYCATKYALRGLTEALKLECQGTAVRVTEIAPGITETEFSLVRYAGDKERADKVYADKTVLYAEDVAEAIFFAATRPAHVNINELVIKPV